MGGYEGVYEGVRSSIFHRLSNSLVDETVIAALTARSSEA